MADCAWTPLDRVIATNARLTTDLAAERAEIERLRAEIERLRAAGDALAQVVAWWGDGTTTGDAVLAGWEEARYG